jgi:hypothetical protein
MGDTTRSGAGPATPRANGARCAWVAHVDGDVYGEPLVAGANVLVATEHNTLYALDAVSGTVRWTTHVGEPIPLASLVCGNIDPNGITSTPVIDAPSGTLYAVAMLGAPLRHEMFAVRVSDGRVLWHRTVDPPGSNPQVQQQRGSLNLWHGRVYLSFGGFAGDCGTYHGWVVSAAADGAGPLQSWQVPSNNQGAVWAAPGPSISPAGEVWVATGNTEVFNSDSEPYDWGNAVVRLTATLAQPLDHWAPKNWANLNRNDVDLGSMTPALLPGGLVFIAGKEGSGYLLRADHLGGIGGELFKDTVCQNGGGSGGAYGGAAVAGSMVYVPCVDGLAAVRVDATGPSFTVAWRGASGANSPVLAYGLVWTVSADTTQHRATWTGTLVGADPHTGAERSRVLLGPIPHFVSPAAANGNLYIAGLGVVYAASVA